MPQSTLKTKVIAAGTLASLTLFLVYFLVVGFTESFTHATEEFLSLAYLMIPLIVGFGVQVSLFTYTREFSKLTQSTVSVGASSGTSTLSMVACCAHHIVDVLAFAGLAAVAVFLTDYQTVFLVLGLLSNIVGITVMLSLIQKHNLYGQGSLLSKMMVVDIRKIRNLTIALSTVVMTASIIFTAAYAPTNNITNGNSEIITLSSRTSNAEGVTVQVTPAPFQLGQPVNFTIIFDTHSGDLSFDPTQIAYLQDSNGAIYEPTQWAGSPPGGHHREGILFFPPLEGEPKSIRLVLQYLYVDLRIFDWTIP